MNPPDEFDPSSVKPVVRRRRTVDEDAPQPESGPEPRTAATARATTSARSEANDEPRRRGETAVRTTTRPPRAAPVPSGSATPAPPREDPDALDEYVVLPPPTSGGRRLLAVGGMLLLVVGIVVGGVLVWASRQVNPSGEPGEVIERVVIPRGASTDAISSLLADEGVITSSTMFGYYVGWKGAGPWEAGDYIGFRKNSSFDEAIEVLDGGPVPVAATVVRVIEGRRLSDALQDIADQMTTMTAQQLQETLDSGAVTSAYKPADVDSWEGLLFPDTYQFDADATPQLILQTMATKMDKVLDSLGYDKAEVVQGRSAYELITIASLIEKETGAPPEERGMISRVISNRLDDDETLGIDASVLYGLNRSSGELTTTDLESQTPYNTRIERGLPPTPISLTSEASLAAAISPTEGDWKYYVLTSNDPPTHFFTSSYREFLNAKEDAQDRGVF